MQNVVGFSLIFKELELVRLKSEMRIKKFKSNHTSQFGVYKIYF